MHPSILCPCFRPGCIASSVLAGTPQDNRQELCIGEYSLSQTSLEQIFNGFAAQKEAEVEPSPEK